MSGSGAGLFAARFHVTLFTSQRTIDREKSGKSAMQSGHDVLPLTGSLCKKVNLVKDVSGVIV
jgi:hypothetical protein